MVKRLEEQKIRAGVHEPARRRHQVVRVLHLRLPGRHAGVDGRTIDYAIDLDPDFANFYPAVPYPGTELYEKVRARRPAASEDWSRMEYSYYLLRRQRPGRARRDGRHQSRQAALLPAAGVPHAAPRRRRSGSPTKPAIVRHAAVADRCSARRSSTPHAAGAGRPRARLSGALTSTPRAGRSALVGIGAICGCGAARQLDAYSCASCVR